MLHFKHPLRSLCRQFLNHLLGKRIQSLHLTKVVMQNKKGVKSLA